MVGAFAPTRSGFLKWFGTFGKPFLPRVDKADKMKGSRSPRRVPARLRSECTFHAGDQDKGKEAPAMKRRTRNILPFVALGAVCLAGLAGARLTAQEKIASPPSVVKEAPATVRITLEEAKQRALSSNKLLNLASLNAESKAFAVKAMRANYFPQVLGNVFYFHFNDELGTVLSGGGRTVTGPAGKPLITFPPFSVNVPVMNQDSSMATLMAVQPITDLLKIRQGVKIAEADEGIARAQLEQGIRKVASGVEQLYWGLLAAQRIRAGTVSAV
jgi:outer membrane protein TolC